MRLVFIGPSGAGKGTQSRFLVDFLEVPHLSTGEIMREAYEKRTDIGLLSHDYMVSGKLVPDPIVLEVVGKALEEPRYAKGWLLDGFPRTLRQAEALDVFLGKTRTPLDGVIELRVDQEEVIKRLGGRGRSDDRPEVIRERLESYWRKTSRLLEYYCERGMLHTVDGIGTQDEVFGRIKAALEGIKRRQGTSGS